MKILMLEDEAWRYVFQRRRTPNADIVWTTRAAEATTLARSQPFDVVMLDYDLAPLRGNGLQAARSLARQPGASANAVYVVHSMNPTQAPRMVGVLEQAGRSVVRMPFWTQPFFV